MSESIPLYAVLLILAAGAGCIILYRVVSRALESARRMAVAADRLETALATTTAALSRLEAALGPAATELQANMKAVPQLLEAVSRVGQAQLDLLQAQRAAFEQKQKNPFGRQNAPAAPRDVSAANLEYDIDQLQRAEGISREEAMLRLNPANAGSVWEGNGLFEGWNR